MEEQPRRFGLGRIISLIGALWIGLFFLARYGLFGSNPFTTVILGMGAFIPIAMMFAGRVIRRRGQRTDRPENEQVPQPPPRRQARPPDPVTFTELADAVSFDDVETTPDPPKTTPTPIALPMSVDSDIQAKTSAEMIADAKKELSADD